MQLHTNPRGSKTKGEDEEWVHTPSRAKKWSGTWASEGRRGLTGRAEGQVLSESRWATQMKGAPGNCSPPGKTPFSIFLGNWQTGRCFSRGPRVSAAFGSGWPPCPDGTCWGRSFWTPSRGCWRASFSSISSLGIFVGIRCRKHYVAYVLDFSHPVQGTCLLA